MVQSQAVPEMTIARLAAAAGVGVESVRYYQRRGLIREPQRPGGSGSAGRVRRYDAEDVRRLRFIKSAQAAGFSLKEIGELIGLDATDDRGRAREMARLRIAALDAQIADLRKSRNALERLADDCGGGAAGPCPILEAFDRR